MAWTVRLYDLEDGQPSWPSFAPVADEPYVIVEFRDLPTFDDIDFPYLCRIDPFGHTFLSDYQIDAVLAELVRFSAVRPSPGLAALIALARRMESPGHRYLLFNGD